MKEKINPLRWLMYLAVTCLFFDITLIYLDATISDEGDIFGIPFHSRGALNPIAPFRIVCTVVFLFLYRRYSKYAWHVLIVSLLLDISAYLILRWQGVYFKVSETGTSDWFILGLWVFLLFYFIKLRPAYMKFILCDKPQSCKDRQAAPYQTAESVNNKEADPSRLHTLNPKMQIQIGKFGAVCVLIWSIYHVTFSKLYLVILDGVPNKIVTLFVIPFALAYAIPAVYFFGLSNKRLTIVKIAYRIWFVFVLLIFLSLGLHELVIKGDFSDFLTFWAPLGIITILWLVGIRGLTRMVKPEAAGQWLNSVLDIVMFIGMFLGFFCGGKLTHDYLASNWPDIPHYDKLRWVLPCFVGAVAGTFVGTCVGAFIGSFIEGLRKGKVTK